MFVTARLVRPLTRTAMSASLVSSHSSSVQQNKKQLESRDPGKNKTDTNQCEITQAETSESEKAQEEAARREIARKETTQQESTAVEVQDVVVLTDAEHAEEVRNLTAKSPTRLFPTTGSHCRRTPTSHALTTGRIYTAALCCSVFT